MRRTRTSRAGQAPRRHVPERLPYTAWPREAEAALRALESLLKLTEWRFLHGDPSGAQAGDHDDTGWDRLPGEPRWSTTAGTAWLRHGLLFPETAEGISMVGSAVDLTYLVPTATEIFLDGRRVAQHDWWADSRPAGLRIIESLQPDRRYQLAFRFPRGDGVGLCRASLRIAALEEVTFEMSALIEELAFVREVLVRDDRRLGVPLARVLGLLDVQALRRREWERVRPGLREAADAMRVFAPKAKGYTVHVIGHSHIDMNWLWPWEHTIDLCCGVFKSALSLMRVHPDLCFSQSQAVAYDIVEARDPSLVEEVLERIREGRWECTSTTLVEGDLNMASGESVTRQLLLGTRQTQKMTGSVSMVGWEPDTFGHPATYPQILTGAGISFYYFKRGGSGPRLFWWESPDGSRVLAYNDTDYNGEIRATDVSEAARESARHDGMRVSLHVFGVGDHGGGLAHRDILAKKRLDDRHGLPSISFSTSEAFFRAALEESTDIPVVRGELNTVFEGCYTTHADIKRHNREGENGLLTAESLAAVCSTFGFPYPAAELTAAWKEVCFNQFHDILAGSAVSSTYADAADRARRAAGLVSGAIGDALEFLAAGVGTTRSAAAPGLIVFNPLGWRRDDVVVVRLSRDVPHPFRLLDREGIDVPFQEEGPDLVFVARGVPAFGYTTFRLVPGASPAQTVGGDVTAKGDAPARGSVADNQAGDLESEQFLLRVDPATGVLTRFYDKAARVEVFRPCPSLEGNPGSMYVDEASNVFRLFTEAPHHMSSWVLGNITRVEPIVTRPDITVVEQGPVRAVLSVRQRFRQSAIEQKIILYRDLRRVEFPTLVDWREVGSPARGVPLLRVAFTLPFTPRSAAFEVPFGHVHRAPTGAEVPALRWVDVSYGRRGVCLLNDCKHGHQADGRRISISLLRSAYEPHGVSDFGPQQFRYAIVPHHRGWGPEQPIRNAAQFNQPLLAVWAKQAPGHLPHIFGLLDLEPAQCVASSLKRSEDGADLVLRFYDASGKGSVAVLRGSRPFTAVETNLLEERTATRSQKRQCARLNVSPFQIKTLLLRGFEART